MKRLFCEGKLLFAVAGLLAAGEVLATGNYSIGYVPDGTNTWVGPVTGGSMSNVNNWVASSPSGYTVSELFARHCFYDCSSLQSGAVLTNDIKVTSCYPSGSGKASNEGNAQKSTMVYGMRFVGDGNANWKIVRSGGVGFWWCRYCRMEIEGGTLEWWDKEPTGNASYPYKSIDKYGSGELLLVGFAPTWECANNIYEGTLAYTNNISGSNMDHVLASNTAKLRVAGGSSSLAGVGMSKSSLTGAQIEIDKGATLNLCNGWNAGKAYQFYGDVIGSGDFLLTGGRRQDLLSGGQTTAQPFAGTYDPWIGEFRLGSADAPRAASSASSVLIQGGGWMRLYADQAFTTISGIGRDGGIDLAAGKSLTVGGSASVTTNTYSGRITGKNFTKTGANDVLRLGGSGEWTGETRIESGRLELGEKGLYRKDIVLYWDCDDSAEQMVDRSRRSALNCALLTNETCLPTLIDDGVSGRALHFGGDCKSLSVGGRFVAAKLGQTSPITGNHAFTFSFWMRPNKNTGRGSNFIHLDGHDNKTDVKNVLGNTVKGITWSTGGFFFGSMEYDVQVADGVTNIVALSPFQKFAFYCGTGWTRWGKWTSSQSAPMKNYERRTMVADFSDNPKYLLDGQWHHVVGSYGGSNRRVRLYVDGVLKEEQTAPGDMGLVSDPSIQIGNYSGGDASHCYNGDLDEILCFGREWTPDEVAAEYAARTTKADSPLVAPIAHWTFSETRAGTDEGTLIVPDQSGNGIDLICSLADSTYTLANSFQIVETPYPAKTGNKSIYLPNSGATMQVAAGKLAEKLTAGGSFTISVRHSECMRAPFVTLGTPATAANRIAFVDSGAPAVCGYMVGDNTQRSFSGAFLRGETGDTYAFGAWVQETLVYDATQQKVFAYIDGKLCGTYGIAFTLKPETLIVNGNGLSGTNAKYQTKAYYDDLRLYDCALDAEQVATMAQIVRTSAGGAAGDAAAYAAIAQVPTNSPVTVSSGATLALNEGQNAVFASLAGEGTVELQTLSTLAVNSLTSFGGNITGKGHVLARAGQSLDLTGKVSSTSITGFENDTIVLSQATASEPLIRTPGCVSLPEKGTLVLKGATVPGAWQGAIFTLAECSSYTGPSETTDWTFDPAATASTPVVGRFIFKNGKLLLKFKGGGLTLILR